MEKQKTYTFEINDLSELLERVEHNEQLIQELLAKIENDGPIKDKKWYSLEDASQRLNCSTKTVSRLIKRGDLCKHLGIRHVRIPHASITDYENKLLVGGRKRRLLIQ